MLTSITLHTYPCQLMSSIKTPQRDQYCVNNITDHRCYISCHQEAFSYNNFF